MSVPFQEVHGMEMLLERVYEPELTDRIRKVLRKGDHFVDVGANMGYFTLLASKAVSETGRVLAFEPTPPTLQHLLRNLELNRSSNVVVLTLGLSDRAGIASMTLPPYYNNGVSHLRPESNANSVAASVPIVRFDDLPDAVTTRGRIRAIKIDTEGHELQVLSGMRGLLSDPSVVSIACELSPAWYSTEELLDYLEGFGFRGEFYLDHKWRPLTRDGLPISQCNAWFMR